MATMVRESLFRDKPEKELTPEQLIVTKLSYLATNIYYGVPLREDQKKTIILGSEVFHSQKGVGLEAEQIRKLLSLKAWGQFLFLKEKEHHDTRIVFKSSEGQKTTTHVVDTNELLFSLISDVFNNFIHAEKLGVKRDPLNIGNKVDSMVTVPVTADQIDNYSALVHFLQGDVQPKKIGEWRALIQFADSTLLGDNVIKGIDWYGMEEGLQKIFKKKPDSIEDFLGNLMWTKKYNLKKQVMAQVEAFTNYCVENICNLKSIIQNLKITIGKSKDLAPSHWQENLAPELFQAVSFAAGHKLQEYLSGKGKSKALQKEDLEKAKQLRNLMTEFPDIFQCFRIDCSHVLTSKRRHIAYFLPEATKALHFTYVDHTKMENINLIASYFSKLHTLVISNASYEEIMFKKELSIEILSLVNCSKLTNLKGLSHAPSLKTIQLQDTPLNTFELPSKFVVVSHNNT